VGRVVVKSGAGRCTFKFSGSEELRKVLDALALLATGNAEVSVLLEDSSELSDLAKALNSSFRVAEVVLKQLEPQPASEPARPSGDVDERPVYEAAKRLVAEKLKRGEQYLFFRELQVAVFGRELNTRNWRDEKLAKKLRKALRGALERIGRELGVKFEEVAVREYGGRAGRFKAYRIVPARKA